VIRLLGLRRAKLPARVRGSLSQNFSPDYIRGAVERSLGRLRTDHIDVLQLHSPPGDVIRRGDGLQTLEALRREGKIRFFGIACDTVDDALSALELPGVSSIQVTVNLLERGAVERLIPAARERGIAVIARECLSNGLLAKEPKDIDPATSIATRKKPRGRGSSITIGPPCARGAASRHGAEIRPRARRRIDGADRHAPRQHFEGAGCRTSSPLPHSPICVTAHERIRVLFLSSPVFTGADTWVHYLVLKHLEPARVERHAAGQKPVPGTPSPAFDELRTISGVAIRPTDFGPSFFQATAGEKRRNIARALPAASSLLGLALYSARMEFRNAP
jgi:hypothetical protein